MIDKDGKTITKYGSDRLAKNARVGMSGVDPMDIRPSQILLVQALSDFSTLIDKNGKKAKVGEYFHTGKLETLKTFSAYILFAKKSTYVDKRNLAHGPKDMYKILAVMADGLSLFGMTFRVSSLYALSGLFSISAAQKRPMYSFKVVFEVKELSNEKGEWFIPVCRIKGREEDPEKLIFLEDMAKGFDQKMEEDSGGQKDEEKENLPWEK